MFAYSEEVFHPIPSLYQYTQNAVCLTAGTGCDTLGNLFLYHARTARYQFFVIQHLEEYLAGYVIRIIARQYERLSVEQALQVHFQEVVFDDVILQLRVGFPQIGHRFIIHFHNFYRALFGQEKLGQHSHARSYFQYRKVGTGVYGVGNVLCYFQVFQKVLAEKLFRFN